MKKLITVNVNKKGYDILLNVERLNGLKDDVCDQMLDHMRSYLEAYHRLRIAKRNIEKAKQEMKMIKIDPVPYMQTRMDEDIPF